MPPAGSCLSIWGESDAPYFVRVFERFAERYLRLQIPQMSAFTPVSQSTRNCAIRAEGYSSYRVRMQQVSYWCYRLDIPRASDGDRARQWSASLPSGLKATAYPARRARSDGRFRPAGHQATNGTVQRIIGAPPYRKRQQAAQCPWRSPRVRFFTGSSE